jgi:hypothetical protein
MADVNNVRMDNYPLYDCPVCTTPITGTVVVDLTRQDPTTMTDDVTRNVNKTKFVVNQIKQVIINHVCEPAAAPDPTAPAPPA